MKGCCWRRLAIESAFAAVAGITVIIITLGALWRFDGVVKKNQLLSFLFLFCRVDAFNKNVVHRSPATITTGLLQRRRNVPFLKAPYLYGPPPLLCFNWFRDLVGFHLYAAFRLVYIYLFDYYYFFFFIVTNVCLMFESTCFTTSSATTLKSTHFSFSFWFGGDGGGSFSLAHYDFNSIIINDQDFFVFFFFISLSVHWWRRLFIAEW